MKIWSYLLNADHLKSETTGSALTQHNTKTVYHAKVTKMSLTLIIMGGGANIFHNSLHYRRGGCYTPIKMVRDVKTKKWSNKQFNNYVCECIYANTTRSEVSRCSFMMM